LKALIVEDDFSSRILLQSFLSPFGDSHIAVNGKEAVQAFRTALEQNQAYDLVCLDILMPEMDGQTALREIRVIEASHGIMYTDGVKIIMTSALGDMKNVTSAFRELCDGYLVKPVDRSKLIELLKELHLTD
jgi:two-component system chemotaxis response regulator CheY